MNEDALKRQGFIDDDTIDNYLMNQTQGLCKDGRCQVKVKHLEECLKKGLATMALVLQQDERVKKDIQMCLSHLLQQHWMPVLRQLQ